MANGMRIPDEFLLPILIVFLVVGAIIMAIMGYEKIQGKKNEAEWHELEKELEEKKKKK